MGVSARWGGILAALALTACTTSDVPTSPRPTGNSATTTTRASTSATMTTSTSSRPAPFEYTVSRLDAQRRERMISVGSWSSACSLPLDDLRLVSLTYWGFDDRAHTGELVLANDAVAAVVSAMRTVYAARFPIRRMVTVEEYGADDETSMRADNTSAFNGRYVEGTTTCSQHAYGRAIDINPLENPMVKDGVVYPATAGDFVDRTQRIPGMIHADDVVVRAFAEEDWPWGGYWHSLKDYQHFSANGR